MRIIDRVRTAYRALVQPAPKPAPVRRTFYYRDGAELVLVSPSDLELANAAAFELLCHARGTGEEAERLALFLDAASRYTFDHQDGIATWGSC